MSDGLQAANDSLMEVIMTLWDSFLIWIKRICGLWSFPIFFLGLANEEAVWELGVNSAVF